jgi:phenylpropionate dioxygenase-like ring-hydroxylating dioxygenase large terminal subunit
MRGGGWYQIAFERDLQDELTTIPVGDRRLLCVRGKDGSVEIFDAICPHRGADLGALNLFAWDDAHGRGRSQ